MDPFTYREMASAIPTQAASTATRVSQLHHSLLEPLARLSGLKLWLHEEHPGESAPRPESPACQRSFCQASSEPSCLRMLHGLRQKALATRSPQAAACSAGFWLIVAPLPVETEIEGCCIAGRTPYRIQENPAESSPAQLAPIMDLLKGIALNLAPELCTSGSAEPGPVQHAKRYIRQNLTGKLTLASIAQAVNLSEGYLSKLFRQAEGTSVGRYLIQERIAYCSHQLISTRKNVSEIAYAAGFESISHFNRSFKNHTGYSPKRYRILHRLQPSSNP